MYKMTGKKPDSDDDAPADYGDDVINIHAILPESVANGPGKRMVIWVQGCDINCPGCFNPDTHSDAPRHLMTVDALFRKIAGAQGIRGITFSGGEPFRQAAPLLELLKRVRGETSLSVVIFSGYTIGKIRKLPYARAMLGMTDVLIDGPYMCDQRIARDLRSSANQRIHFLTQRYTMQDIINLPEAEIVIDSKGNIHFSGLNRAFNIKSAGPE